MNKADNNSSVFPSRLREALETEGKSQGSLAKFLGVSPQMISYYKSGKSSPDWETIRKICLFFGISSDWFLGLSDLKSLDSDVLTAVKCTGLSETAVQMLNDCKYCDNPDVYFRSFISLIIENSDFFKLYLHDMYGYKDEIDNQLQMEHSNSADYVKLKKDSWFAEDESEDYMQGHFLFHELTKFKARELCDGIFKLVKEYLEEEYERSISN